MKNEKYTFIKYNYNNEKKRLLYIYENGTIIGINVKNEICELSERKIGKKKVDFIKRIINNDNLKVSEDHNTIIVNEDSNINEYDSGVFYLILMLINEKGVYNDKIFFKYDLYFSSEFDYAVKSLKYEEKIEKFIFVNWCPAEIEGNKIINVCRKIINNISINLKECNLTDLKYFADN